MSQTVSCWMAGGIRSSVERPSSVRISLVTSCGSWIVISEWMCPGGFFLFFWVQYISIIFNPQHKSEVLVIRVASFRIFTIEAESCFQWNQTRIEEDRRSLSFFKFLQVSSYRSKAVGAENFQVRRRPLLVISVIGVQSSGKSTLMNYLFGCSFATHVGRCTKVKTLWLIWVYPSLSCGFGDSKDNQSRSPST